MGYNTTVVVLNDALGYIEKDPEFGKKLVQAILQLHCSPDEQKRGVSPQKPSGGVYLHGAIVVETHHADDVVTVDVGGNTAVVVTSRHDPSFPSDSDRETHRCFACDRPHAGFSFEDKYCDVCGSAVQERKTLYEALQIAEFCLRKGDPEGALDYIRQALLIGPMGERLDVLDWKAISEGRMTKEEAYEAVRAKMKEKPRAAGDKERTTKKGKGS